MTAHAIVYAPIGQASRSELVVERLSNAILAGLLEADEQLPNEADLSRMLGVSPVTVREALNTLRMRNLIDTRRGRNGGSFVCKMSAGMLLAQHPLKLASSAYLADLGEWHCAVISHSTRLAAQRSTAQELLRFEHAVEAYAATEHAEERAHADMRCLLALAANAQSARLANQVLMIQAEWAPLVATLYQYTSAHEQVVEAYRQVAQALRKTDAEQAATLAQNMIYLLTDQLLACKVKLDAETALSQPHLA